MKNYKFIIVFIGTIFLSVFSAFATLSVNDAIITLGGAAGFAALFGWFFVFIWIGIWLFEE